MRGLLVEEGDCGVEMMPMSFAGLRIGNRNKK